jgi:hypothetical protein
MLFRKPFRGSVVLGVDSTRGRHARGRGAKVSQSHAVLTEEHADLTWRSNCYQHAGIFRRARRAS